MIIMNTPFSRNFSSSTYGSSVNPLGSATGQTEGRSKARRKMQDGRKSIFMLTHRIFVSRILLESSLVLPFFFKFKHHSETTHVRSVSWLNCLRRQFALYHCLLFALVFLFYNCSVHALVCLCHFVYSLLIFVIDFVCTVFFVCSLLICVFFFVCTIFVLLFQLLPLTAYLYDCCSLLTLQLLVGTSIQNRIYSILS